MSSTSLPDDQAVVAVVEPVGIVGNLERSEKLSTSPQANRVVGRVTFLGGGAAET